MSEPAPAAHKPGVVRFGVFELDRRTGELRKAGVRVNLQGQPLQVLAVLIERPGELVTRDELKRRLWPADTFVDFEQGMNAAVKRLRHGLDDSADTPRFIETLPRRGYRFIAPVEGSGHDATTGSFGASAGRRLGHGIWFVLGAIVVAGGLTAVWLTPSHPSVSPAPKVVPLTTLPGVESDPALSPDGRRLAFCWDGEGAPGLYLKTVGGNDHARVARGQWGVFSPAWSPDGRHLAFLRRLDTSEAVDEIVIVPAAGGPERRLGTTIAQNGGLDWSPDGRTLAFVDKASAGAPDAVFLMALDTGDRRRLTTPADTSPALADYQPTFSPDGRAVAFGRRGDRSTYSTGIYLQEIDSSIARPITAGFNVQDMAWASDGGSLVFVSGRGWEASLWRVEIVTGKPHRLAICNSVARVTAARNGETLAFERRLIDHNVWRGPGPAASDGGRRHALFRSPAWDLTPAYSPDGSRIAFMSARTGRWSVWTCTSDGTECTEFPAPASMSVPRWSPDGRSIAVAGFRDEDPLDLYRLELASGFARRLTSDNAWESMPSWSRDGRWLYFSSNRTGVFELWKMPAMGGEGRQLTRQGGIAAHETADGRWIYFINRYPFGSLWRMPSDGGRETLVLDKRIHSDKWTLWQDRIVYVDEQPGEEHRLVMFDPEDGRTTHLGSIGKVPSAPGLAVSPDGKWILNAQTDQVSGDILMVESVK